jgi:hypothetical protein
MIKTAIRWINIEISITLERRTEESREKSKKEVNKEEKRK